ncbi:hypothetical protein PG991_008456 [Apiospora marii]|uniref:Guanine nucleotide-exchange factor SEC12 n=2 Tax=Apiospora marii TaxID=335849 RepID=A0ABR1RKU5_9PEZI
MAKSIPSATITLSYPLWACAFDPHQADQLLVGGGGGPGRNGVTNKLTLLDVSNTPNEIKNTAELELSSKEDNVTSLAFGPRRTKSTVAYAGVNGSPEDVRRGNNQHFRVLSLSPSSGKTATTSGVQIAEASRHSLFASTDPDTYQRLLRVTQPYTGLPQLGALATGLSRQSEIALFDVPLNGAAWKPRGTLDTPDEAMDLDVVQTGTDTYQLAYCDKHEIFTVEVTQDGVSDPKLVYSLPCDDGPTSRPSFRSIRYLNSDFVFAVVNAANRKGVILHGYRLPKPDQESARLAVVKKLPKSVTQSTGLAVRNLSPPASPTEPQGDSQFVVAVAGSDSSISLLTLDYKTISNVDLLTNLDPFYTVKSAHPAGITGLSFSTPPPAPKRSKSESDVSIKLASVSMANTAVVHNIPLKNFTNKSASRDAANAEGGRYIVAMKPQRGSKGLWLLLGTILMFTSLVCIGLAFIEAKGFSEPVLGTNRLLPASWTVPLRKGPVVGSKAIGDLPIDVKPEVHDKVVFQHDDLGIMETKTFGNLLSGIEPAEGQKVLIRHDDSGAVDEHGLPVYKVEIHEEESHGPAKSWEELDEKDQRTWRKRLEKTGHWAENMGESVLKGVVFGEIGGAIGAMVGEAL